MYLINQSEVVRYENHAAVELVYGISECIDRFHVQMIGGLIKQQQMRYLPSQPGKYNPTTLTIGQLTNRTNLNKIRDITGYTRLLVLKFRCFINYLLTPS